MLVSPERVLNLYRLYVFYAVARNLSFSEAADQLHTSQPNTSKHVRLLENELRTELFDRPGRQLTLTDAGRIVFDYTERVFGVVGEMRRALDELQGLERGYLRLGASSTPGLYILPTLIANFWELYPGLEVTLNLGNSQEIVSKMLANQIDLGFVEGSEMTPGIQAQPLISDQLVWIVSPGSALAQKSQVDVSDLGQEALIWREAGSGTRQAMARFLASVGIKPRHSFVLQSCEGVKRAVAAGLGISLVSQRAIDQEVQLKTLMILKGSGLQESGQLIIISRKDLRPTAATLAFLAHVRKSVQ